MTAGPSPKAGPKDAADRQVSVRWTHSLPETPVLSQLPRNSFATEQYRNLATQIEQRLADEADKTPVLVITSADPDCGKTLTSINLAIALARGGKKRILLIEGDLWKPTFASWFQRDEKAPGFANLLADQISLAEATVSVWKANIDILFAGNHRESADFVISESVETLLQSLRNSYDLILIDSPPIVLSLGRTLAACADAAIVVVRTKRSSKKRIEEALSILGPEMVIGLVLNDISMRTLRYGAYRYGSYASFGAYAAYAAYEKKSESGDLHTPAAGKDKRRRWVQAIALSLFAIALALGWWIGRKTVGRESREVESSERIAPRGTALDSESFVSTVSRVTGEAPFTDSFPTPPAPSLGESQPDGSRAASAPTRSEPAFAASVSVDNAATVLVRLNLRTDPGLDHAVRRTLAVGTVLDVRRQREDWLRVDTAMGKGWVHRSGIALDQGSSSVSLAEAKSTGQGGGVQ